MYWYQDQCQLKAQVSPGVRCFMDHKQLLTDHGLSASYSRILEMSCVGLHAFYKTKIIQ